jgi:Uma2 family endonuclease
MEPDACYWVQSEDRVRGRTELDLEVDPPPDLVLEAEASRSVLDRLAILAAIGVGEVWRHDGERLEILLLDSERATYAVSVSSRCFPWLPVDAFARRIGIEPELSQQRWVRSFREWVRRELEVR